MKRFYQILSVLILVSVMFGCSSKEKAIQRQIATLVQEGSMAMSKQDFETAEQKFLEVIKLDPGQESIKNNLAVLYARFTNEPEKAQVLWEELLEQTPHNSAYLNNLAGVYRSQKNYDRAIELYEEAKKHHKTYHMPYYNIGTLLYEQGDYYGSAAELNAGLEFAAKDTAMISNYSNALICAGRFEEATRFLEEKLKEIPDSVGINLVMARLQKRLGKYDEGIRLIERALQANSNDAQLMAERIEIALADNAVETDVQEMVNQFKQIEANNLVAFYPQLVEARLMIANDKYNEALEVLNSIHEIPIMYKYFRGIRQHVLSMVHRELGDIEAADEAAKAAIKYTPELFFSAKAADSDGEK